MNCFAFCRALSTLSTSYIDTVDTHKKAPIWDLFTRASPVGFLAVLSEVSIALILDFLPFAVPSGLRGGIVFLQASR